jgi:HlyD family secretion protein
MSKTRQITVLVAGIGLALTVGGACWSGLVQFPSGSTHNLEGISRALVQRSTVQRALTTAGTLDSTNRTLIECELDRIEIRNDGRSYNGGGTTTILSLVPDGSVVKQGDLICELDSSDYVEMARQQRLQVEESRAEYRSAELRLETAEEGLREFQEGLKLQAIQELQGNIALAEANVQTALDRLEFSERMFDFGYLAPSRLANDRIAKLKAEETLRKAQSALENYVTYEVPMILLTLQGRVETARSNYVYEKLRLERHEERLALLEKQIDLCEIRAPHDGFVVYANEDDDDDIIEVGARVRSRQDLFYLPDLSQMQIHALIHESRVQDVRAGMDAKVVIEAFPDQVLRASVTAVDPLPLRNSSWRSSSEVKNFAAHLVLKETPPGLKPGMSAVVEILTGQNIEALTIPVGALVIENGQEYCYVVKDDDIERREITISQANTDYVCVEGGLNEGEEVVVDPQSLGDRLPNSSIDDVAKSSPTSERQLLSLLGN